MRTMEGDGENKRGAIFSVEGTQLSSCSASTERSYKIQEPGRPHSVTYVYI